MAEKVGMKIAILFLVATTILIVAVSTMKAEDPAWANREALTHDLENMAAQAQRHYYLPLSMGGGNGSFTSSEGGPPIASVSQLTSRPTNSTGTFTLGTVAATSVVLTGTGTERGNDGSPIEVVLTVFRDSTSVAYTN